jgi:nicotinamide-nucleotide amidase
VIAMPGVPDEMRAVFREGALPLLLRRSRARILVRRVKLFGVPESTVDERVRDLTRAGRNPSVGLKVDHGSVSLCLRATAPSATEAEKLLLRDVRTIRERFGQAVLGLDDVSLAEVLGNQLVAAGMKLAVAESCTGGLVGDLLTDVPGISQVLLADLVCYSNESKVAQLGVPADQIDSHGAVSPEVARSMASGACRATGAELGISTTGIAGPGGGTAQKPVGLVYVGICLDGRTRTHRLQLRGPRRRIKDRAARHALNFARLALL